jgi:hypothetical protein
MTTWQEEAQALPPPSQEEMDEYADGIVSHKASDGTILRFDPQRREWRAEPVSDW